MATIGSLPRMTATQLSELVLAQAEQKVEKEGGAKESKLAIVDVRDDGKPTIPFPFSPFSTISISLRQCNPQSRATST
jgi:hypothetical protein